jgi:hypothetical protein
MYAMVWPTVLVQTSNDCWKTNLSSFAGQCMMPAMGWSWLPWSLPFASWNPILKLLHPPPPHTHTHLAPESPRTA